MYASAATSTFRLGRKSRVLYVVTYTISTPKQNKQITYSTCIVRALTAVFRLGTSPPRVFRSIKDLFNDCCSPFSVSIREGTSFIFTWTKNRCIGKQSDNHTFLFVSKHKYTTILHLLRWSKHNKSQLMQTNYLMLCMCVVSWWHHGKAW